MLNIGDYILLRVYLLFRSNYIRRRLQVPCGIILSLLLGSLLVPTLSAQGQDVDDLMGAYDCYISTGDSHWLAVSLPIDSEASINTSFDLLKDLGIRRIYWRGLQAKVWIDGMVERPESPRYYSFWKWNRELDRTVDPNRLAINAARERGLEIWGVATLSDWGSTADTPPYSDYPFNCEHSLRLNNPQWVPVDKYGVLKQGGAISFAYPEARKSMADLYMKHMIQDGYDGMIFLTYAENHSMRFKDEFGYNDIIAEDFKKRYGIDIRYEDWTRFASRDDWRALRGEYLTEYIRELKQRLEDNNQKLGFFLQANDPRELQPWNVPQLMPTAGNTYLDLETWVREHLVDLFMVYGYSTPTAQRRTVDNMTWMTRGTETKVSMWTSNPFSPDKDRFRQSGIATVGAFLEDEMYLARSNVPMQSHEALGSDQSMLRMKILEQVIHGKTAAGVADIAPLVRDENLIVRRLALRALSATGDPRAVPHIESSLKDPESSVRCIAAFCLRKINGPNSLDLLIAALDDWPKHQMAEIQRDTLNKLTPFPLHKLSRIAVEHKNPVVRSTVMRSLAFRTDLSLVSVYSKGIEDVDRFARYAAAKGLGNISSSEAVELLIESTTHSDPVVSNRAATSLALIYGRNDQVIRELKPQILEAVKHLYCEFGDDSTRADIDWGYRPVGEALLNMGVEGEAVLRDFYNQTQDIRLAELAWKTLFIRKEPNSFSEVTEKENEVAFAARPASMRSREFSRLKIGWDNASDFTGKTTGMAGDVNKSIGRWGHFALNGPAISDEKAHGGRLSLKLVRGGGGLSGTVTPGITDGVPYKLQLWVNRDPQGSITMTLRGLNAGSYVDEVSTCIQGGGSLMFRDLSAGKWVDSGLVVPSGQWVQIVLNVNRITKMVSVSLDVEGRVESGQVALDFEPQANLKMVAFSAQGVDGSTTYIDDIELVELP